MIRTDHRLMIRIENVRNCKMEQVLNSLGLCHHRLNSSMSGAPASVETSWEQLHMDY